MLVNRIPAKEIMIYFDILNVRHSARYKISFLLFCIKVIIGIFLGRFFIINGIVDGTG